MNDRIRRDTNQSGWLRIRSIVSALAVITITAFSMAGCGGSSSSTPTVEAPGEPANFTVDATPEAILSATLTWSLPLSGGDTTSFEIYRNTTAGSTFDPANHLLSIQVDPNKTTYDFIDDVGLEPHTEYYYVVAAKNAGGETPTPEKPFVTGGGPPGGTGDTAFGNNFSAALIFADGVGIGGAALTGTWTTDVSTLDFNTGLRPLSTEVLPVVVLPYLDPDSAYILNNVTYYRQKTASTWQGEWVDGSGSPQSVNAAWGDNLISQNLTVNSVIRIEMVLSEALTTPMTSYTIESLYGTRENEVAGTDGTTYDNYTAFVFAANAHLTVQKLDDTGAPDGAPLFDQPLWTGDGPGHLAGEVNVLGNFTYGFVWNLKDYTDASLSQAPYNITTGVAGTWRITFSLDPTAVAPANTPDNTTITSATNGVLAPDGKSIYIDINVAP